MLSVEKINLWKISYNLIFHIISYEYLLAQCKVNRAGFFSVIHRERAEGKRDKLKIRNFHLNRRKNFWFKGHQILEQVNWRGCGISVLGDVQNPAG